jgi:hypothetical protein
MLVAIPSERLLNNYIFFLRFLKNINDILNPNFNKSEQLHDYYKQ